MRAPSNRARGRRPGAVGVALLCLALGVAVVGVAACGASSSATPGASPSAAPTAAPSAAPGTATPGTPGAGPGASPLAPGAFTVDLPTGWRQVSTTGDDALLAELAKKNPAFAQSLQSRLDNLSDNATYVAVDARESTVGAGNVVTLIVTEVDLPADVSLQTFTNTIQGQVQQLVEEPVAATRILVAAGEAYIIEYVAPIERADGTTAQAAITQVLYVVPGRGYVMTFSAPPAVATDYGKVFADIATSFTLAL